MGAAVLDGPNAVTRATRLRARTLQRTGCARALHFMVVGLVGVAILVLDADRRPIILMGLINKVMRDSVLDAMQSVTRTCASALVQATSHGSSLFSQLSLFP